MYNPVLLDFGGCYIKENILAMMMKYRYIYLILSVFVFGSFLFYVPTIVRDWHRYASLTVKDTYSLGRLACGVYLLSVYFKLINKAKLVSQNVNES